MTKTCQNCMWLWARGADEHDICQNPMSEYSNPEYNVEEGECCGKERRLWEPKEETKKRKK